MKKYYIMLTLLFLFTLTLFSQSDNFYTIELKLTADQGIELLKERYPFAKIKSENLDLVTVEVEPKYFNNIRFGEFEFKVIGTPKPNYVNYQLPKNTGNADPIVQSLVNSVSSDTIRNYILALQNFGTRYEYAPQQDSAGVFIYNQFSRWGLQTEFDTYAFGSNVLYDLDFLNENVGWIVGTGGLIVKTENGGESWLKCVSGISTDLYGVDFIDALTGWAVGRPGVIRKTTNGGLNWFAQTSGVSNDLFDVNFVDSQNGLIVGSSGIILRTTNGGTNWTQVNSGTTQTLRELSFVDNANAWTVGTAGTIRRTTNGGLSWTSQSPPSGVTNYLRAVNFINSSTGWIVGNGRVILKTTNSGNTWNRISAPAGVDTILRGVSFINETNGWIVDYNGRILNTTNGGENWSIQYSHLGWRAYLANVKAVSFNRITVCGSYGNLYSSTNAGISWKKQTSNLPSDYIHVSNNVVATIPGLVSPEKECIIVAHYDSYSNNPYVSAPGANDNATGTVAVMEAARLCKEFKFENTIRFLAVSGEELGMFGSDHYAFKARDEGRNIIGVVNGDMIGYPTTPDTSRLVVGSYQTYNRLIDSSIVYNQRYGIGLTLVPIIDNTGASDYGPFALAGYDALDVAEATAEEIWGGADPYYHTVNDTYDKLRPGLIKKGTQLMLATVAQLAKPVKLGSISGRVINDLNCDSSITNDPPLSGWTVKIYNNGFLYKRVTTDINGNYSFTNLLPGTYTVEESLHVDWIQTIPRLGLEDVTLITYGENSAPRGYIIDVQLGAIFTGKDFGNFYSGAVTNFYTVSAGWNLVSLPLIPTSYLKTDLFPTATSSAYAFENEYITKDTLETRTGYWLKFPSAQEISINGHQILRDTIDLKPGWNLIGSISYQVAISEIAIQPPDILASGFYEYNKGYKIASIIKPMQGYWIKANSAGKIILPKP